MYLLWLDLRIISSSFLSAVPGDLIKYEQEAGGKFSSRRNREKFNFYYQVLLQFYFSTPGLFNIRSPLLVIVTRITFLKSRKAMLKIRDGRGDHGDSSNEAEFFEELETALL